MSFKVGDKITYRLSCNHGTIVAMGEDYAIVVFDNSDLRIAIRLNELDLHNPELTPDDLAKMDGERVWVDDLCTAESFNMTGWCVVIAKDKILRCNTENKIKECLFGSEYIKIYRHKPERNEDMENQLKKINLFTRRELSADEVCIFSVILCDNEVDRDFEQFTTESLEILGGLYIGKTGVFDHNPKAENQCARIFDTEIIRECRNNSIGEPYTALRAWAYMVRCDKNADLIREIDAGIKKEVSVSCAVEKVVCSICGKNQKIEPCKHKKNEHYGGKLCFHKLANPTDAYEWSFVAVPAQKQKPKQENPMPELKTGCKYCTEMKSLYYDKKHDAIRECYIEPDKTMTISAAFDDSQGINQAISIKIKYCPMCGNKLIKRMTISEAQAKLSELMGEDIEIVGCGE